ncbi:MAG: thermostable hemolysin delta-VPH [Clostridia bacterium]|nr:thermostable hemolysin delta-VPH [Clostridia bacterium]
MFYYNYHGIAKRLIKEGHLLSYSIMPKWNDISPALVLFFDNHNPMPIREYHWEDYLKLIHIMQKTQE